MARNTLSRSLHDVGLAAWFGGTLANAVALNAAAAEAGDAQSVGDVANAGWDRWTPVNAVAIGAHLIGSVGQLRGNRDRLKNQQGVATMSTVKSVLTIAALGVTGYSRVLGQKTSEGRAPSSSGTKPALTGALVVVSSFAGEQQRPASVLEGLTARKS